MKEMLAELLAGREQRSLAGFETPSLSARSFLAGFARVATVPDNGAVSQSKAIYLDTMLWNALFDERVEPDDLLASLTARQTFLSLGLHNFYEFAKIFRKQTGEAAKRAQGLFSYVRRFLDLGIWCVKENDELLAMEMWALQLHSPAIDAFHSEQDRALVRKGFDELANGGFDKRTADFIDRQAAFASEIRKTQITNLENRPDAKEYLRRVDLRDLEHWLERETRGPYGAVELKGHIRRRFPEATDREAMEYALALTASPASRIARGIVRAGSYYMWRCANRGSVPADLFDDMYHVLNSAHCDVYATQEVKQKEYAQFLLTANTRVAVYTGHIPIAKWILALE
jgi:hypothetical protein